MTTTVRLLATYDGSPPQTLRNLPDALATSFVAQGSASLDLTGGVRRYQSAAAPARATAQTLTGIANMQSNQAIEAIVPAGTILDIGVDNGVGRAQRFDATGIPVQTWGIATTNFSIGPFGGPTSIQIQCDVGQITVTPRNAAGTATQAVLDQTGALAALANGEKRASMRKTPRHIMSRAQTGRCKTIALNDALFTAWAPAANTAGLTLYNRIALAADAEAVRILVPNMHTASVAGVKVGLGLTSALGTWSGTPPAGAGSAAQTTTAPVRTEAVNSSGGDMLTATWGGAAVSGTLPSAYDAANLVASYTATDWMPITTVARTDGSATPFALLDVAIEYPAGSTATLAFDGSAYALPSSFGNEALYDGRVWRAWAQDVLGVTTPAAFTRRDISGYYIPIIVQYRSKTTNAVCECVIGDSIYDGTGAGLPLNSFARRAAAAESTAVTPIEYCNLSVPGASSAMLSERAQYLVPMIKPGILHFEWGTANNISGATMSARQTQHALGAFGVMMALADQYDAVALTGSFLPISASAKALGATDSIRTAMNTTVKARTSADTAFCKYSDYGPAIDDPVQISGQTVPKATLMLSDGIHPNEAGHAALAIAHRAALREALAWA